MKCVKRLRVPQCIVCIWILRKLQATIFSNVFPLINVYSLTYLLRHSPSPNYGAIWYQHILISRILTSTPRPAMTALATARFAKREGAEGGGTRVNLCIRRTLLQINQRSEVSL